MSLEKRMVAKRTGTRT